MFMDMNNVVKSPRKSKIFGRRIPVRPLEGGKMEVEGVVYEKWELAACRGMSDDALIRYHNTKVNHEVDHSILCGHAANVDKVKDAIDGEELSQPQVYVYNELLTKIPGSDLVRKD